MKKTISILLSVLLLCNMFTLTNADETTQIDNSAATKLANKINSLYDDACTLDGNVVTLNTRLRRLSETLVVENGGEVILDLNNNNINSDDGICPIEISKDAKLTIKGDGRIVSDEGVLNNGIAILSQCDVENVYNNGNLTIENECNIDYLENKKNAEVVINSAYICGNNDKPAIVNAGRMTINDGGIDGGWAYTDGADGQHAIVNEPAGDLTIKGGHIVGGTPDSDSGIAGAGIYVGIGSSVYIYGGTIEGGGYCETPASGIINEWNLVIYEGLVKGGLSNDYTTYAKAISGKFIGMYSVSGSDDEYIYTQIQPDSDYTYNGSDYGCLKFEKSTTAIRLGQLINYNQPDACYWDGDTVYLKTDVTATTAISISGAEPCTLDMCGYTITFDGGNIGLNIDYDADVTIERGTIICESIIFNYGKIKLNCCIIKNNISEYSNQGANTVTNHNTGELELNDCYIYGGDGERIGGSAVANNGGIVTINGGYYYGGNAVNEDGYHCNDAVHNYDGTVLIKSGTFVGGTYNGTASLAITSQFDIAEGTYVQESDDGELYTKVYDVNEKQYLQVIAQNSATKLADIIEEYSPKSCSVKYGDTVKIIKPVEIDDVITIPAGDDVTFDIENFSCKGIYVPENAKLSLAGVGEIIGEEYAVLNDGTVNIRGGTYKGGIINHGSLFIYYGEVVGADGMSAITTDGNNLVLNGGTIISGSEDVPAISGHITGGLSIKESDDGINYTLITGPESDKPYIYTEDGTNAEVLAVNINLYQPDTCYCWKSEDFEQEKVVLIKDCNILCINGDNVTVDFNGHTFGEIHISGHGITLTGKCIATGFIENVAELFIDDTAEINGIIRNQRCVITEGIINGGILNSGDSETVVDGGVINGSADNFGSGIYNNEFNSRIIINKGIVNGADDVENSSAIHLKLRSNRDQGILELNGGALIGGTGNAISADVMNISAGGGSAGVGGSSAATYASQQTVYVHMNGGILVGGEGKSALSGNIAIGDGITLKSSDDGINYDILDENKTRARYVKAESTNYVGITSVALDKNYYSMEAGDSFDLSVIFQPQDATNEEVIWSSTDESVATIKNGVVYGVAFGRTAITATTVDGLKQATCLVDVIKVTHGGGGNLGGGTNTYYNVFTFNVEHDGTTAQFDVELQTNEEIKGVIYIGVYDGNKLVNCQVFDAQDKHVAIDCASSQYIRIFWWDENMSPLDYDGYLSF